MTPTLGLKLKSYENLLLSITAMTYSKAGDDIVCRLGGGLYEGAGPGTFANQLLRAT